MKKKGTNSYKTQEVIDSIIKMKINKWCSTRTILDFLQKDLGYKQTRAYQIYRMANDEIKKMFTETQEHWKETAIGQLQELAEEAKLNKKYKLAFEIRKDISDIVGLYIERIEHSGEVSLKTRWGDDAK